MRIVFHGANAASFSNDFGRLVGGTADIRSVRGEGTEVALIMPTTPEPA